MSSENTVTDRLLTDARKKTARQENSNLGKTAMIVGIVALVVSPISIVGWIMGAVTLGLGAAAIGRPNSAKHARIALILGFAAIVVATFFYTLSISI